MFVENRDVTSVVSMYTCTCISICVYTRVHYTVAFIMTMYMYIPGVYICMSVHALLSCMYFQTLHLCSGLCACV